MESIDLDLLFLLRGVSRHHQLALGGIRWPLFKVSSQVEWSLFSFKRPAFNKPPPPLKNSRREMGPGNVSGRRRVGNDPGEEKFPSSSVLILKEMSGTRYALMSNTTQY